MMTHSQVRIRATGGRRAPALAAAVLVGLLSAAPPSGVAAQAANNPTVQIICEAGGGPARTVRVIYPTAAVKNVHVFTPLSGGANVVIYPPATANQVYQLAVPAGSYKMKYATQMSTGGYPPSLTTYGPVIVIPPFRVERGICQRSQRAGSPSS